MSKTFVSFLLTLGLFAVLPAQSVQAGGFDQHLRCFNAIFKTDMRHLPSSLETIDGSSMILPTYKSTLKHQVQTGFWIYTFAGAYHFQLPKVASEARTYYFKLSLPRQLGTSYFAYDVSPQTRPVVRLGYWTSEDGHKEIHFDGKPFSKLKGHVLNEERASAFSNSPMDLIEDELPYDNYGTKYAHGRMRSYLVQTIERLSETYAVGLVHTLRYASGKPAIEQHAVQKAVLDALATCKKIEDSVITFNGKTLSQTAEVESGVVESLPSSVQRTR